MSLSVRKLRIIAWVAVLLCSPAVVFAAKAKIDPITPTWSPSNFPATTALGASYSVTYTLRNNLPFPEVMKNVSLTTLSGSGFSLQNDTCSNQTVAGNGGTCTFAVGFTPTTQGSNSVQVTIRYDNNVVPLPALTSSS